MNADGEDQEDKPQSKEKGEKYRCIDVSSINPRKDVMTEVPLAYADTSTDLDSLFQYDFSIPMVSSSSKTQEVRPPTPPPSKSFIEFLNKNMPLQSCNPKTCTIYSINTVSRWDALLVSLFQGLR